MTIEAIGSSLSHLDTAVASMEPKTTGVHFDDWLNKEIATINDQIQTAESQAQALALGEADNLHQVMISFEKAKLSFELGLQVRNKLLEGFQEIMRMQV